MKNNLIFQQFRTKGCLSYIVGSAHTGECAIIDPSENVKQYEEYLTTHSLQLRSVIDTHTHADHLSGAEKLATQWNVPVVMSVLTGQQRKIDISQAPVFVRDILKKNSSHKVDVYLDENEQFRVGDIVLQTLQTPGHTQDALCFVFPDRIITGDTLLIGQIGRTDLPGGNPETLYETLQSKILPLDDDLLLYPGHDYSGNVNSSLGYERRNDVFLKSSPQEFFALTQNFFTELKPDMHCGALTCGAGQTETKSSLHELFFKDMVASFVQHPSPLNVITPQQLRNQLQQQKILILDVRNPEELKEKGAIPGSKNIPLPELPQRLGELPQNLNTPIIVHCQSGTRSAMATLFLKEVMHYNNIKSLEGGMNAWTAIVPKQKA